ncbi:MAG: lytic transglycosylase domain-containing protein [Oxalobacteraceae bacterium]|nr:MAG: lytic transglycosylase domain-containing protein [Oxalobacteraceae bacterium]
MLFGMELMSCPDLAVPLQVMQHVVRVESSHNPYAIGVVGGHLVRQPKNLSEALSTVRMLESRGFNFSLGMAQVNRYNLDKYGLDSYEKAFEVCPNLQAGSRILAECYNRSGRDWGKSFSCYYSGNFVTGYRHGYVQKIYASMQQTAGNAGGAAQPQAIPVVSRPSRRTVGITRYPVYNATPPMPPAASLVSARVIPQTPVIADSTPPLQPAPALALPPGSQDQPVMVQGTMAAQNTVPVPLPAAGPVPPSMAAEATGIDEAFVF